MYEPNVSTFTIIKGAIPCTSQTSEHSLLQREQFHVRAKRQNIHYYKGSNSMYEPNIRYIHYYKGSNSMYEPNVRTFTIIKGAISCTSQTSEHSLL